VGQRAWRQGDQGQGEKRLEETLRTEAASEPSAEASAMVESLSPHIKRDRLLLLLLDRELQRLPKGEVLRPVDTRLTKSTDSYRRDSGPPVSHAEFSRDAVVFRVNLGAESRAEPGWLLPLICRRGGVTRREVGAIRVGSQYSEFEIAGEAAKDFALAASQSDPRAPHVHMEVASRAHPPTMKFTPSLTGMAARCRSPSRARVRTPQRRQCASAVRTQESHRADPPKARHSRGRLGLRPSRWRSTSGIPSPADARCRADACIGVSQKQGTP